MTQKPMLRAEVYARALRASQNRKEDSVKSSYVLTSESGGRATHTVIELSFHLESNVALDVWYVLRITSRYRLHSSKGARWKRETCSWIFFLVH